MCNDPYCPCPDSECINQTSITSEMSVSTVGRRLADAFGVADRLKNERPKWLNGQPAHHQIYRPEPQQAPDNLPAALTIGLVIGCVLGWLTSQWMY